MPSAEAPRSVRLDSTYVKSRWDREVRVFRSPPGPRPSHTPRADPEQLVCLTPQPIPRLIEIDCQRLWRGVVPRPIPRAAWQVSYPVLGCLGGRHAVM